MEQYFNNLLFTYFPHIAFAVFWFGLITRIIISNKTIRAQSSQFLADRKVRLGSNLFHVGIIAVFFGHFTLFIPEEIYHILMSTETKRMIAIIFGTSFGIMTFVGMFILVFRRVGDKRIKANSNFQDYFILILLIVEAGLGLASVAATASTPVTEYSALAVYAQKIVTFQPDAGAILAGHSIVYKLHIFIGLLIFMIFPYTKLMHMLVYPVGYFFRSGFQLVRY